MIPANHPTASKPTSVCQVCNGKATGLHYGVPSCASCKAFFHRSLKSHKSYRCRAKSSSGVCGFIPGSKKSCRYCRFKKCLAAGMSVEAIKVGRYCVFRPQKNQSTVHKDIQGKEIHSTTDNQEAVHDGKVLDDEDIALSGRDKECDVKESGILTDSNALATESLSTNALPSPLNTAQYSLTPTATGITSSNQWERSDSSRMDCAATIEEPHPRDDSFPTPLLFDKALRSKDVKGQSSSAFIQAAPKTQGGNGDSCPYNDISNQERSQNDCQRVFVPGGVTLTPNQDRLTYFNGQCDSQRSSTDGNIHGQRLEKGFTPHPTASTVNALRNKVTRSIMMKEGCVSQLVGVMNVRAPSDTFVNIPPSLSLMPTPDSLAYVQTACLYTNKEEVMHELVKAYEDYNFEGPRVTTEEIHREQRKHIETCSETQCTFGPLRLIETAEYDAWYGESGIDIDNRRDAMAGYLNVVGLLIGKIVKFAHGIPGFRFLKPLEKLQIIKRCRSSVGLLIGYRFFNKDLIVGRCLAGNWICSNDVGPEGTPIFRRIFDLCDTLQKMEICKKEMVILSAMVIMASGINDGIFVPLADVIYKELYQLLMYVCLRHKHPPDTMTQFLKSIEELSAIAKVGNEFLRSKRLYKYSDLFDDPFYSAVLSDIVPRQDRYER